MDKWELKKHFELQIKSRAKLDALDESIKRLRSRLESPSISRITDEPRANKTLDDVDRIIILREYEDEYNKIWDELIDSEARVKAVIAVLEDPLENAIMHHRYINCLEWDNIKKRLDEKEQTYSQMYLYEIHGKALKKISEFQKKETLLIE